MNRLLLDVANTLILKNRLLSALVLLLHAKIDK
jgi:hypothetical protein